MRCPVNARLRCGVFLTLATVGAISVALIVLLVSPAPLVLARAWTIPAATRNADVIVVLGGGATWPGVLMCGTVQRLQHGVALYRSGYAPRIIVSGGANPQAPLVPTEAELMRRAAIDMGLAADVVVPEARASRTYENGTEVVAIMRRNGWRTAILVTDALHMRRAKLVFDRLGIDTYPSPSPTPWIGASDPGQRALLLQELAHELVGTIVYRAWGWV